MKTEEYLARAEALVNTEATQPLAWWWLSFCDASRPKGSRFLGACLVKARGFYTATLVAHALGCNPGGECQGTGPIPIESAVRDGWADRLLTREECAEFDRVHAETFKS